MPQQMWMPPIIRIEVILKGTQQGMKIGPQKSMVLMRKSEKDNVWVEVKMSSCYMIRLKK